MRYSITSSTDGCYPGTSVLINKLGLTNQEALDKVETVAVTLHAAEIESEQNNAPLTLDFYLNLHRRLFSDLYDWAGQLRTVDLSKKGTSFYPVKHLRDLAEAKFDRFAEMDEFQHLNQMDLLNEITDFYHELNMLHLFREGNGRTQRLFFTLLLRRLGYSVSFADCDTDELMMATIYAAQGITTYLHEFFSRMIENSGRIGDALS